MGPVNGTMTAKTGLNAVMGPVSGTMTAVWTCDETGLPEGAAEEAQDLHQDTIAH